MNKNKELNEIKESALEVLKNLKENPKSVYWRWKILNLIDDAFTLGGGRK